MTGCFAELDVALDDGLEDELAEVTLHLFVDLVGEAQAAVVHGQEEAFYLEARVHARLHYLDGVEQFADAFEGEVLALYGYDDAVGCRQGVDRDESEAGAAVDEDVVVVLYDGGKQFLHDALLVLEVQQFYLSSDEVDVGGHDVEPFDVGGIDDVADVNLSEQGVVDGVFYLADVHSHAAGGIGLRVGIHEQYFLFEGGKRGGEVHAGGRLAHTALLIDDGYGFTHLIYLRFTMFCFFTLFAPLSPGEGQGVRLIYFANIRQKCEISFFFALHSS